MPGGPWTYGDHVTEETNPVRCQACQGTKLRRMVARDAASVCKECRPGAPCSTYHECGSCAEKVTGR